MKRLYQMIGVLGILVCLPVSAQNANWYNNGGKSCELTFQNSLAPTSELKGCVTKWETYISVKELTYNLKKLAASAFRRLYRQGDAESKDLAKTALDRINEPLVETERTTVTPQRQIQRPKQIGPAVFRNLFDAYGGKKCLTDFKDDTTPLSRIKECTIIWETYKNVAHLEETTKIAALRAFRRLYEEGNFEEMDLAKDALMRMGESPQSFSKYNNMRIFQEEPEEVAETRPQKRRISRSSPSTWATQAAFRSHQLAFAYFTRGQHSMAIAEYKKALQFHPGLYVSAYNIACLYAMQGNKIEAMYWLNYIDQDYSGRSFILKARTDNDFTPLYNYGPFRELTGYISIALYNGGEDADWNDIIQFKLKLEKNKFYKIPNRNLFQDSRKRKATIVFYRSSAFKREASGLSKMLGPEAKCRQIPFKTDYDIVILWAPKPKKK